MVVNFLAKLLLSSSGELPRVSEIANDVQVN